MSHEITGPNRKSYTMVRDRLWYYLSWHVPSHVYIVRLEVSYARWKFMYGFEWEKEVRNPFFMHVYIAFLFVTLKVVFSTASTLATRILIFLFISNNKECHLFLEILVIINMKLRISQSFPISILIMSHGILGPKTKFTTSLLYPTITWFQNITIVPHNVFIMSHGIVEPRDTFLLRLRIDLKPFVLIRFLSCRYCTHLV